MHNEINPHLVIDLVGTTVSSTEREYLTHPLVAGVILFTRNFEDRQQLCALTQSIRKINPRLFIAVDQEGGRVQRFRQGFFALPAMGSLGQIWDNDVAIALTAAKNVGCLMAAELVACGIDFSFAPVLDLNYGRSQIIGNRAFHHNPEAVAQLAKAFIEGMAKVGMAAVGKHFPGHGYAEADSHIELPHDFRPFQALWDRDLIPYRQLASILTGIMPAHVLFPQWDEKPAGYSQRWLMDVLRNHIGFHGLIFSDDLSMAGALSAGSIEERADSALRAGCDLLLVCNDAPSAQKLLDQWRPEGSITPNIAQLKTPPVPLRKLEELVRESKENFPTEFLSA